MAKFHMMYSSSRQGLDKIIEADIYRTNGKFFEFITDKEVVRTLKIDIVTQIRRMSDGEGDDAKEGDQPGVTSDIDRILRENDVELKKLIAAMPDPQVELQRLLGSMPDPDAAIRDLLKVMPDYSDILEGL